MLLELRNVVKEYPPVTVLNGVCLHLDEGESAAIVGPSGSGKSTLLHIIGALDTPSAGEVVLNGKNLAVMNDDELAAFRSRSLGFVFQAHHLLPHLNLLENVLVPTMAKGAPCTNHAVGRAKQLLERVGLGERLAHRPGQLSGGECQRAAVVRALINQPKLLLADEPTGALDHQNAEELAKVLLELNREEKVAMIVVTHWRELAERMGKVYEIADGKLREEK